MKEKLAEILFDEMISLPPVDAENFADAILAQMPSLAVHSEMFEVLNDLSSFSIMNKLTCGDKLVLDNARRILEKAKNG